MSYAEEVTDGGSIQAVEENIEYTRDELESAVIAELDAIWKAIEELAVELCPCDTGALRLSITLESEGGSGSIFASSGSSSVPFYSNSIYAGDPRIINPKTGKATSEYADLVESGHMIGSVFWEGVPFLEDALMAYEAELMAAVDQALEELGAI
jgi:hypothetical protein